MTTKHSDAGAMARFCTDLLPEILHEACDVPRDAAGLVGEDVLRRADDFAGESPTVQEVLAAAFIEESCTYAPVDAPDFLKAFTTVVVRNSALEHWHAHGDVNAGGIEAITTAALAPLSHLIASRRGNRSLLPVSETFSGLADSYPRAWASMTHLRDATKQEKRRVGYRPPVAEIPELPGDEETIAAERTETGAFVLSGTDPRFDAGAVHLLRTAAEDGGALVAVSSLSRFSRDQNKLMRILEILLVHDSQIITSNTLLRSGEVHRRVGAYCKPDSRNPFYALHDETGLGGLHRKMVRRYLAQTDAHS